MLTIKGRKSMKSSILIIISNIRGLEQNKISKNYIIPMRKTKKTHLLSKEKYFSFKFCKVYFSHELGSFHEIFVIEI